MRRNYENTHTRGTLVREIYPLRAFLSRARPRNFAPINKPVPAMQTNTDRKVSSAESSKEEQTIISFQLFFFEDAKEELEKNWQYFCKLQPISILAIFYYYYCYYYRHIILLKTRTPLHSLSCQCVGIVS